MISTFFEFVLGGILLIILVRWKLADLQQLIFSLSTSRRLRRFTHHAARAAVGLFVVACFIDPLIPGSATINIQAPQKFPLLAENLRIAITPMGFQTKADVDRCIDGIRFDNRGFAVKSVAMAMFETRVEVRVYDVTRPMETVAVTNAYISPFVRREFLPKTISF